MSRHHPYARPSAGGSSSSGPVDDSGLLQTDVVQLRAEVRSARAQLDEAKLTHERHMVEMTRVNQELKARREADAVSLQRMEANVAFIAEEDARKAARIAELDALVTTMQRESDGKLRALQRDLHAAKEDNVLLRNESSAAARQHQNELDVLKLRLSGKRDDALLPPLVPLSLSQQQQGQRGGGSGGDQARTVETYERQLMAKDAELQVLQQKLRGIETYEAMQRKVDGQVDYMRQLQRQVTSLEGETQRLREQVKLLPSLEEQRNTLLAKVSQLESAQDRQIAQMASVDKDKGAWMQLLEPADREKIDSPAALARALMSLRHEYRTLLGEQGNLRGQQHVMKAALGEANDKLGAATVELNAVRQQLDKDQKTVKRLEKARGIAQKEIEFLRSQLDSYDSEQTMMSVTSMDEQKTLRIKHLETLLQEAQRQVEEVTESKPLVVQKHDVQEPMAVDHRDDRVRELESRLDVAAKQIKALETANENLERQLSYLERQQARGDFNPATTKVIHLKMNPESRAIAQRQQALAQLQEENRRLLRELEGPGAAVAAVSALAGSGGKVAELEQKLVESETRMKRLKEVFGRKILEFREVCYSLTGWQIEMSGTSYRLGSMFAEREGDYLLFAKDPQTSAMLLLESDFSRAVAPMLGHLLQRRNSIPAITASVLLDQFSRTTAM